MTDIANAGQKAVVSSCHGTEAMYNAEGGYWWCRQCKKDCKPVFTAPPVQAKEPTLHASIDGSTGEIYDITVPATSTEAPEDVIRAEISGVYMAGWHAVAPDFEGEDITNATQAIQRLLVEARIEEIENLPDNVADLREYLPKRRAELEALQSSIGTIK